MSITSLTNLDLNGINFSDIKEVLGKTILEYRRKNKKRLWVVTDNSREMKKVISNVVREYKFTVVENLFNSAELIIDL